MGTLLLVAVVGFAVLCVITVLLIQQGNNAMKRRVAEVNKKNGTHFGFGPNDALGNNRKAAFFDPKTYKILFYDNGTLSLQDWGYIRGWELHWTDRPGQKVVKATNVFMRIMTADLNRPIIDIPMRSKDYGDVWEQRLKLILNGR